MDQKGLTTSEAKSLLEENGPNKLPESPPPSSFKIFLDQIKNPLVYVLLVAAVITTVLKEYTDTAVIAVAVLLNTVLGFIQEKRANNALNALKELIHPETTVIRESKQIKIPVEEIVIGDIVVLNQGDKIPADGVLIFANRFFVTEAVLTGESSPINKDKKDEVYMGTVVSAGRAFMKVVSVGGDTKMGEIAVSVQELKEDTPMKKQLNIFSKQLSYLVFGLTIIVFVIGLAQGLHWSELFKTSVALAVSAIPEGLLVALTVVLAIGMQRIVKRKGLVRHLVSAETLGGVTTICTDKTGTLTQGKMQVVEYYGTKKDLIKQGLLANDLDDPMVIATNQWASDLGMKEKVFNISADEYKESHKRFDTIPFSSKDRYFAALTGFKSHNMLFVNGAPEYIMEWCGDLSKDQKQEILKKIDKLTSEGKRLIGMAQKRLPKDHKKIIKKDIKDLKWNGILALNDPVRTGVKDALNKTKSAGIDVLVITGDYAQTAVAVMKQVGLEISEDQIVLGTDLEKLSESELARRLNKKQVRLFARTTPDQKLKIVNALQSIGEVVAMMGDGVNDAPALSKSDIGIVVGDATDVAKESADLVLLDSSFSTIVAAIEEGRGIFDNIRKIILYLMSDAFAAIVAVLGSLVFSLPIVFTASQILWINLVSDGFPYLALTIDPKRDDLMREGPRDPKEKLLARWMIELIAIVSTLAGIIVLLAFYFSETYTSDIELARSFAFATLGLTTLLYVFSIRTLARPVWSTNPFNNKWLLVGVFGGFLIFIIPFVIPQLGVFFQIKQLPLFYWGIAGSIAIVIFCLIEFSKWMMRSRFNKAI